MRELIGAGIGVAIFVVVWVGLAAFAKWGFDPKAWSEAGRVIWAVFGLLFAAFAGVGGACAADSLKSN